MSDTQRPSQNSVPNIQTILEELDKTLILRKSANPEESYTANLFHKGLNKILEKIGEEAIELVIASKNYEQHDQQQQRSEVIYETADLWFHTLIALSHFNISSNDVLTELARRFGQSGIDEKAARTTASDADLKK